MCAFVIEDYDHRICNAGHERTTTRFRVARPETTFATLACVGSNLPQSHIVGFPGTTRNDIPSPLESLDAVGFSSR